MQQCDGTTTTFVGDQIKHLGYVSKISSGGLRIVDGLRTAQLRLYFWGATPSQQKSKNKIQTDEDLKRFHSCIVDLPLWWTPLQYLAAICWSEKPCVSCLMINIITGDHWKDLEGRSSYAIGAVNALFEDSYEELHEKVWHDEFLIETSQPVKFVHAIKEGAEKDK